MTNRKDRFSLPWEVVEVEGAFQVRDPNGVIVSRTSFYEEGKRPTKTEMSKAAARQIADKMVSAGLALAPLAKDSNAASESSGDSRVAERPMGA